MGETIQLLVEGGKATAGPPLGPALGGKGINIGQVVKDINEKTSSLSGMQVPVKVIVTFETKSYEIEIGTPPTSALLKKQAGIEKGASNRLRVGSIAFEQVIAVANTKSDSLYGGTLKAKVKEIVGTCVSTGILVDGKEPKQVIKEISEGKYDDVLKAGKTNASPEKLKEMQAKTKELQAAYEKAKAEAKAAAEAGAAATPEAGAAPAEKEEKPVGKKAEKKK